MEEEMKDYYCPFCNRKTTLPALKAEGKKKKCKGCGEIFRINQQTSIPKVSLQEDKKEENILQTKPSIKENNRHLTAPKKISKKKFKNINRKSRENNADFEENNADFEENNADFEEANPPEKIGFGLRFLALIIDTILLIIFFFIVALIVYATFIGSNFSISSFLSNIPWVAASFSLVCLYFPLIEGLFGTSPGKSILGLKIGTEEGKSGNTNLYLFRYLVKNSGSLVLNVGLATGLFFIEIISSLIFILFFFGAFIIFFKKQCLWDVICKTAVFKKNELLNFTPLRKKKTKSKLRRRNTRISAAHNKNDASLAFLVIAILIGLSAATIYKTKKDVQQIKNMTEKFQEKFQESLSPITLTCNKISIIDNKKKLKLEIQNKEKEDFRSVECEIIFINKKNGKEYMQNWSISNISSDQKIKYIDYNANMDSEDVSKIKINVIYAKYKDGRRWSRMFGNEKD